MKFDNEQKLRPTGLTLDEVRSKLSGLHFGQEALSTGEKEILHLAESLLNYIDLKGKRMITSDTIAKYPASLLNDRTKIGPVVHVTAEGELFFSLDNGVLTLKQDGTWHWSER